MAAKKDKTSPNLVVQLMGTKKLEKALYEKQVQGIGQAIEQIKDRASMQVFRFYDQYDGIKMRLTTMHKEHQIVFSYSSTYDRKQGMVLCYRFAYIE